MLTSAIPAVPAAAPVAHPLTPVPHVPAVPQEILDLVGKPLFRGEYTATERDTWHKGIPLVGPKRTSTRDIAYTNDFNILVARGPMIGYAAKTQEDAVRAAADLAFDWSDPAYGGQIYASVGVAVLQAKDGAYYSALVGSGNPNTSSSELGYRSDRFDDNIGGSVRRSADAHATSKWTAPVDRHGAPVDEPAPDDASGVTNRHVRNDKLERLVPSTPLLKAVVDVNSVYDVG